MDDEYTTRTAHPRMSSQNTELQRYHIAISKMLTDSTVKFTMTNRPSHQQEIRLPGVYLSKLRISLKRQNVMIIRDLAFRYVN